MLAAYRALPSIRNEESFRGWLGVVGHRICSRIKREEALHPILSLADGMDIASKDSTEDSAENARFIDAVKSAVEDLDPLLREVYELRELQGLTTEESAAKLGISSAAVKSRLHRAREKVRAKLDEVMHSVGP